MYNPVVLAALAYMIVFNTAFWGQNTIQAFLSSTETAVVFSLEKVTAGMVGVYLLGEKLCGLQLVGITLIVVAMISAKRCRVFYGTASESIILKLKLRSPMVPMFTAHRRWVLNDPVKRLTVPLAIQTRRPQNVDTSLRAAIRAACTHSPRISACYLLNSRRSNNGETALLVAVVLDDEQQYEHDDQQFQHAILPLLDALRKFPPPPETWIISASSLGNIERYRGTDFYVRDSTMRLSE